MAIRTRGEIGLDNRDLIFFQEIYGWLSPIGE
jgi:hypothetical protein